MRTAARSRACGRALCGVVASRGAIVMASQRTARAERYAVRGVARGSHANRRSRTSGEGQHLESGSTPTRPARSSDDERNDVALASSPRRQAWNTNEGRTDDITIITVFISQKVGEEGTAATGGSDTSRPTSELEPPPSEQQLDAEPADTADDAAEAEAKPADDDAAEDQGRRGSMFTPESPSAEPTKPKHKTRRGSMKESSEEDGK